MSFSSTIKDELAEAADSRDHCRLAFLAAVTAFIGRYAENTGFVWSSENLKVLETVRKVLKKLFGAESVLLSEKNSRNVDFFTLTPEAEDPDELKEALQAENFTALMAEGRFLSSFTKKNCCVRAALRGAFLAAGTLSNPDRFYHFEIVCRTKPGAEETAGLIERLGIHARIIKRKASFVVYVKDSDGISDLLGYMGASRGMLEMENARIIRQTRGNVNRKVNCETANINKTANASARQIEDILFIEEKTGLEFLPNGLDETARLRIKYPEYSLQELGQLHSPPISKSGVNHRLAKISGIAESLKSE